MLKVLLSDGSMRETVLSVFSRAGLTLPEGNDRCRTIRSPNPALLANLAWVRPQESPVYVADGLYDLGFTGQDWVAERGVQERVVEAMTIPVTRGGGESVRLVLAVAEGSPIQSLADIPDSFRIATEYPNLVRLVFEKLGRHPIVEFSFGGTEGKVSIGVADAVVDLTDSGKSLTANGLRIVGDPLFVSQTCVIANSAAWHDLARRPLIDRLLAQLQVGVTSLVAERTAKGQRLMTCNCTPSNLDAVCAATGVTTPTVSPLGHNFGFAVQVLIPLEKLHQVREALRLAGASKIVTSIPESVIL